MTRARKYLALLALTLSVLVVSLAVIVHFFNWNLARPYIASKVTSSTGRSFAINGDLEVRLSMHPRIIAHDVVLGNAPWSVDPTMAAIQRADFRINLLKLLSGRLSFHEIRLSEFKLLLEVNKEGSPNWVFGSTDKQQAGKQREFPEIGSLEVDRGTFKYRDPISKTDMNLEVNTVAATDDSEALVEVTGKGQFKGMPTLLQARGGTLLALRTADRPYPIQATAMLGTTKASINGMLIDPLHLNGQEVNFQLEGTDLALLYTIVGVPLPPTPAYKLAGFLSNHGDLWRFTQLKGMVRIPFQTGHGFHGKLDSHSTAKWTLIPAQTGQ